MRAVAAVLVIVLGVMWMGVVHASPCYTSAHLQALLTQGMVHGATGLADDGKQVRLYVRKKDRRTDLLVVSGYPQQGGAWCVEYERHFVDGEVFVFKLLGA